MNARNIGVNSNLSSIDHRVHHGCLFFKSPLLAAFGSIPTWRHLVWFSSVKDMSRTYLNKRGHVFVAFFFLHGCIRSEPPLQRESGAKGSRPLHLILKPIIDSCNPCSRSVLSGDLVIESTKSRIVQAFSTDRILLCMLLPLPRQHLPNRSERILT